MTPTKGIIASLLSVFAGIWIAAFCFLSVSYKDPDWLVATKLVGALLGMFIVWVGISNYSVFRKALLKPEREAQEARD